MQRDYAELRRNMVEGQLRTTDVTSASVVAAFLEVPREAFVPSRLQQIAYIDEDLEVAPGRFVMEPSPLGKLIQLANVKADDVVLDLAPATGYSSAIFSRICSSVIAVDPDQALVDNATETFGDLGYDNIVILQGDPQQGCADEAPFDVIFLNGAVDYVPDDLIAQLRPGGRLVAVEGKGNAATAKVYVGGEVVTGGRRAFNCAVRDFPGFKREASFSF